MKNYLILSSLLFSFSLFASQDSWFCKIGQGNESQVFEFKNPTNEFIELNQGYSLAISAYNTVGTHIVRAWKGTLYNRFMIVKGGFGSPEADSPPSISFDYRPANIRVVCGSEIYINKLN